jgi:hypothetical protein
MSPWRILRINSGTVRVADAQGQPPNIPFWLGEAPGRTNEVSRAVSNLREELGRILARATEVSPNARDPVEQALASLTDLPANAASQIVEYLAASYKALGALPSQDTLIMERFFDESGGMQLVIHSPFGIRVNRAWGLALRKRFCRSFNFELQAATTDDAIVISLGTQHSFPLDEVFHYLNSKTVRELLVQALLDAPMFPVRWRWNAERALALPRQRGGHKVLARRVKDYDPRWLDQLCFTGRIAWGRLTQPQNGQGALVGQASRLPARSKTPSAAGETPAPLNRMLAPIRSSPIALLLPPEKRVPFAGSARRRRHKAVSSVEFAGRWSLLRDPNTLSPFPTEAHPAHHPHSGAGVPPVSPGVSPASATSPARDQAVETFAQVLLRRYGVVFRAVLARESLKVSWYELGRIYRRLDSRGEIRGGHFVGGVGGEQFALPEAIGLLRSIRKTAPDDQTVTISGADPLNLTGILGPGRRVASTTANRVLLRAGVPVAALVAGEVENLEGGTDTPGQSFERALRIGSMQAALRPYYG